MAILERIDTGTRCVLLARHLIGRSSAAHLRLVEPTISGEHATLRWNGHEWEIIDLASRNGTTVNGRKLRPGEHAALVQGSAIGLGNPAICWKLVDDSPPTALALPEDGGQPIVARDSLLALPDDDHPEIAVYRNRAGDWVIEQHGEVSRIGDGDAVTAGKRFVLHLPEIVATTWDGGGEPLRLDRVTLRFGVSRDEEHVELSVIAGAAIIDLGARAHFYLLLTLARARLDERAHNPGPESGQGWIHQDELASMLDMDEQHINVNVYRCRRQLAAAGVVGAANVVERRIGSRQLRLGVTRVEIVEI